MNVSFVEPRLPKLTPGVRDLMSAAEAFAFDGTNTDLLHPEVIRELCFPDHVIMPLAEMPAMDRTAVVATAIAASFQHVLFESLESKPRASVSNPQAYVELMKVGKKVKKITGTDKGPIFDENSNTVERHVAAGVVYDHFSRVLGKSKECLRSIEQA
jgi:hypothetical protein